MSKDRNDTTAQPPEREAWHQRFARWFEPYGILIAVCALVVAFATLWMEFDLRNRMVLVMKDERDLREKTLEAMKAERKLRDRTLTALEEEKELRNRTLTALKQEEALRKRTLEALKDDELLREASLMAMLVERLYVALDEKDTYAGHVPILERLARVRVDLKSIDMGRIRFDVPEGIDLNGAELSYVKFDGADLSKAKFADAILIGTDFRRADLHSADLRRANLAEANLKQADLSRANLSGANLKGTNLRDTNVSNTNFQGARGLTQGKLYKACTHAGSRPVNLPSDSKTGKPLVWRSKTCKE